MSVLGWDLGGAHVKAALCSRGRITRVWLLPCPLWRDLEALRTTLARVIGEAGAVRCHAATMTGELADVFVDRADGVRQLLGTLTRAAGSTPVHLYAHPQRWLSPARARHAVSAVASANWSASAAWLALRLRNALFVDIGSTTTDLIPVVGGAVRARGDTDASRLASDELVYTGVVRTPVMAMAPRLPHGGEWRAPMAEVFATSADVYRLLGRLPAQADQMPSADGRGKSRLDSARRLGRMLGSDAPHADALADCAAYLAGAQLWQIESAARRVLSGCALPARAPVVGAGVGRFLARDLAARLGRGYRDMDSLIPAARGVRTAAADCAPAACLALLLGREA